MTKEYIEKNLLNKNKELNTNKRKQTNLSVEELYLIYHGIEAPLCGCGQKRKFYNFVKGYKDSCGLMCNSTLEIRREKTKKTNKERYGVEHVLQSPKIQEKIKKINLERHGTENPFQSPLVKEKIKKTNKEKYGVDHPSQSIEIREKTKKTNKEKYGVECPFQSKEIQEKIKKSNKEKYGVEYTLQDPEIREKIKKTNKEKYGTENVSQSKEIQEKIKKSNKEKYGVEYASQSLEVKEKTKQTNIERYGIECLFQSKEIQEKIKKNNKEKYGVEYPEQKHILNFDNINEEYIRLNFIKDDMFLFEDAILYFNIGETKLYRLKAKYNITESNLSTKPRLEDRINALFDGAFITNTKSIIKPLELDLYSEEFKFAIEYDGLMFHSSGLSAYGMFTDTDKRYHLNKTLKCQEKDIILFHIFENEWLNEGTRDIWISKINSILKRNKIIETNIIKEISIETSYIFIQENCLEQNIYNENIGLFYEDELVMVISLEEDIFKVVSKKHLDIINGKEILIDYIIEKYKRTFKTIINRRWYSEDYINFKPTYTEPNSFYFNKSLILETTHQENYRKIWDCGNIILEKEYIDEGIHRK